MTWESFFYIKEVRSKQRHSINHIYFRVMKLATNKKANSTPYRSKEAAETAAQSMFKNMTFEMEKELGLR